jgi:3-hydroxybutyryl-CoA dehydrogenase
MTEMEKWAWKSRRLRCDLVGLYMCLKVLEYLRQTLGEKYKPSPLLQRYVWEGRLGRKSGRGVYDYPQQEIFSNMK